jgi:hypothetical protein
VIKDLSRRAGNLAYDKLVAPRRDARPMAKHLRNLASIANELLGRPLRPAEEVDGNAPASASAGASTAATKPGTPPATRRAPVLVYFDGRDHRTLARVEELLKGRGYDYRVLDVSSDEAELSWATTAAKATELPLVFVAGAPLGGWQKLLDADVSGELARLVAAG